MEHKLSMSQDAALDEIIEVLELKPKEEYYDTKWGKKNLVGLKQTIVEIFNQHGITL